MTQSNDIDLSYLNARDDSGPEFSGPDSGFRRIQHMNAHNFRRGTSIHNGGFLIQANATDAYPEFGKREVVKLGENPTDCYTAQKFRAAVLGYTDRYWVLHGPSAVDGRYQAITVDNWIDAKGEGLGEGWRCDGRCTVFVVPQSDPLGRTWSLTLKGKENVDAVASINSGLKATLNALRVDLGLKSSIPLSTFDLWVDIGVSAPMMSGKAGAQSEVSPITLEPIAPADLRGRLVGRDNAAKFLAAAREVRALIDTGRFAPSPNGLNALGSAPPAAQIAAPAAAPARSELSY